MALYTYGINTKIEVDYSENSASYNLKLRFSSPRHIVTYLPMVSDYATSISIATCDAVNSKNSILINDWTKYIYKNIEISTVESIFQDRQFYYFTDDILITDEYVYDDDGILIPAYKKHVMTRIGSNEAFVLNSDMEKIDSTLYKYDKRNYCVYHNLDIINGDMHFVSYNVNGVQILEVLGDEPIYKMLDGSGYTSSGTIDSSKKTYSVAITNDGRYYIRINYNPALTVEYDGTYSVVVKPLSLGRPAIFVPSTSELTEDWNVDILTKTFIYEDNVYLPIEYFKDDEIYRPVRPFKLRTLQKCKVAADHIVKTPDDNIVVGQAEGMFITLFIFSADGLLKHILTTDYTQSSYTGMLSSGVRKNFTPSGIINANANGYIMLSNDVNLNDSDIVYATYYVRSRSFTISALNLNPYLNEDIRDKKVYIFINPISTSEIIDTLNDEDGTVDSTIRYAITDSSGIILETNFIFPEGTPWSRITVGLPEKMSSEERDSKEWDLSGDEIIYNTDEELLQTSIAGEVGLTWENVYDTSISTIVGENIDDLIFSMSIQWDEILIRYGYTYDGVKDNIEYYTFTDELIRNILTSGSLFINIKSTKSLYSTIDARSRGGGIKGHSLQSLVYSYQHLQNLSDVGMYDGIPMQDCGLVCASIDVENVDKLGIDAWNKKIKDALSKVLPSGTLVVVSNEDEYLFSYSPGD